MRIEQHFVVQKPLDAVWALMLDVPAVSRCLPGAELTEDLGDGRYRGRIGIRLGPINAGFDGEATVTVDEAARSGRISGVGLDRRGGSRGSVEVSYALAPDGTGTRVALEAEVTLAGPIAQWGRTGLVTEVAKQLIGRFASCLEATLGRTTAG